MTADLTNDTGLADEDGDKVTEGGQDDEDVETLGSALTEDGGEEQSGGDLFGLEDVGLGD